MGLVYVHLGTSEMPTDGVVVSPMQFALAVVHCLLVCKLETLQAKPDPVVRTLETLILIES